MSDPAVALDAFAENWRITWRDSIKTGDELVMETAYLALLAEACRFRTEARAGRAAREALGELVETLGTTGLDVMEDMFCYVPVYFREKWKHEDSIDAVKAALAKAEAALRGGAR